MDHQQQKLSQIEQRLEQLQLQEQEIGNNQMKLIQPSELEERTLPQSETNRTFRDSVAPNDNLEDLADIALYGAALRITQFRTRITSA